MGISNPKISNAVTVTPALAETLLATTTRQRPLRRARVAELAHFMETGKWSFNGASIKLHKAEDGTLTMIDGQHRCHAAIAAGVSFETVITVVNGDDMRAFETIDSGSKRTAGDILAAEGVPYATRVAAAARLFQLYTRLDKGQRSLSAHIPPTNQDIRRVVEKYPAIVDAAAFVAGNHLEAKSLSPQSALTFGRLLTGLIHPQISASFFNAILLGADKGTAAFYLRRSLLRATARTMHRPNVYWYVAMMIKGWNAQVLARGTKKFGIRWQKDEPFPLAVNRDGKKYQPKPV